MLAPFLRKHRAALVFAVALNCLVGFAVSFQTLMPKYLIDDIILAKGLTPAQRYARVGALTALYLFATVVARMGAWHWSYRHFTRVRESVLFGLRVRFFRHINDLCLRFHSRTDSGELFNYLFGSPLNQVQLYFHQLCVSGPGAVVNLVSSLIWVWHWDWVMASLLTFAVTTTVLMMQYVRRRVETLHKDYQSVEGKVSGQVADLLRGHRDVKLYAMESQVIAQFETQAGLVENKSVERDIGSHIEWMKAESLTYFFFALMCAGSVWCYINRGLTVGEVQAFLLAYVGLQIPLGQLLQIGLAGGSARASLKRLDAVLSTMSTAPDPAPGAQCVPGRGEIVFRDVHFAYGQDPTLRGINLRIPFGQRVAFVGPSGAGKTTVAQLLLRFYLTDRGAITIDGCDLRDCRGTDVRRLFGVVPQDPYFFRANVRDNIRLVSPEADDDALRRVCEASSAWHFIEAMPEGLDTRIGEGGSTLSGGQRQRLAIARALLHDPSYFIFDEATSALDTLSERLIQTTLDHALTGRTAIFIAHRLATVRTCDRIIVLENGCVRQDGGYDELVSQPGLFRAMVESDELRA